jgi:hypothetical protein
VIERDCPVGLEVFILGLAGTISKDIKTMTAISGYLSNVVLFVYYGSPLSTLWQVVQKRDSTRQARANRAQSLIYFCFIQPLLSAVACEYNKRLCVDCVWPRSWRQFYLYPQLCGGRAWCCAAGPNLPFQKASTCPNGACRHTQRQLRRMEHRNILTRSR